MTYLTWGAAVVLAIALVVWDIRRLLRHHRAALRDLDARVTVELERRKGGSADSG